jgi:hypothetical protein
MGKSYRQSRLVVAKGGQGETEKQWVNSTGFLVRITKNALTDCGDGCTILCT